MPDRESVTQKIAKAKAEFIAATGREPDFISLGRREIHALRWEMGYISAPDRTLEEGVRFAAGIELVFVDEASHAGLGVKSKGF